MPIERAAAEIDPVDRIASKSAIFPGPIRPPDARSMRMERCVLAIMPHPEQGAGRNHADGGHSSREMFCAIVVQKRKPQLANDKKVRQPNC
jgi:hypothetical protein